MVIQCFSVSSHPSFRGVAVITSVSHTEGPRFDPGRKHFTIMIEMTPSQLLAFVTIEPAMIFLGAK